MELEMYEMTAPAIGAEQIQGFLKVLQKYKTGKAATDRRIVATEQWWKLRNTEEEKKETEIGRDGGFTSRSAWLHNIIVSKHADAMKAFPEALLLAREQEDEAEARMLTAVVPCILENNRFEQTYSDVMWQKMKTGTGAYKVMWDQTRLNGLGDIRIERVNLLNLYWEPGITDIQKSRYFFQTELVEKEVLLQRYPFLEGKLTGSGPFSSRFLYDDAVAASDYATVVDVYYRRFLGGRTVLHYCKFVGDQVLFATENSLEPAAGADGVLQEPLSVTGLYDHGLYPYVLDVLFPIEGSPCGYGYVDLEKNPQTEIDLMKTAFVKNAMAGAIPRYFARENGAVRPEDFLDLSKALIPVSGALDETGLRRVEHNSLDGNYLSLLQQDINELRQTSGNTETATGSVSSGVTAASAIAALQEASGKGSLDSNLSAYRAFSQVVGLTVELIRQFYTLPRTFRILGQYGTYQYRKYSNAGLLPRQQELLGIGLGLRRPVFDIRISAQKKNAYTTVSQNELALQFYRLGFFNPQMAEQALLCLNMMDFDGKDAMMLKISQQARNWQRLQLYRQSLGLAEPAPGKGSDGKEPKPVVSHHVEGLKQPEHALVTRARQRAANLGLPGADTEGKP